jgi:pyridoxamine 5'-phosphate oxidase
MITDLLNEVNWLGTFLHRFICSLFLCSSVPFPTFVFMNKAIADLRKEYSSETLLERDVAQHPIQQFQKWWEQAVASDILEPNAMTLATASADGLPSARIVLIKDFDERGFVFYTNYTSFKAAQLDENPKASLLFHWKELERQVRIMGLVAKVTEEESNAYFQLRPIGSRIGAWASPQSRVIQDRGWLEAEFEKRKEEFNDGNVPLPPHWGGYRVKPVIIEFWQGRYSRLHDRIQYSLDEKGSWKIERLAP